MKLFGYWRSGTSYRVRLALAYKGIDVETVPVNLLAGEHHEDAFKAENPSGAVPTLVLDDGARLSQSGAIIEYLEDRFPEPPLLPVGAKARGRVRQLCQIIGCDVHPLQNLRVQKYLQAPLDQPKVEVTAWLAHFMAAGMSAFEAHLAEDTSRGDFCAADQMTMADCYLIPQLFSMRRFGISVEPYAHCLAVEEAILALPHAKLAHPDAQPDAVA